MIYIILCILNSDRCTNQNIVAPFIFGQKGESQGKFFGTKFYIREKGNMGCKHNHTDLKSFRPRV
jgi:hypothetical protein